MLIHPTSWNRDFCVPRQAHWNWGASLPQILAMIARVLWCPIVCAENMCCNKIYFEFCRFVKSHSNLSQFTGFEIINKSLHWPHQNYALSQYSLIKLWFTHTSLGGRKVCYECWFLTNKDKIHTYVGQLKMMETWSAITRLDNIKTHIHRRTFTQLTTAYNIQPLVKVVWRPYKSGELPGFGIIWMSWPCLHLAGQLYVYVSFGRKNLLMRKKAGPKVPGGHAGLWFYHNTFVCEIPRARCTLQCEW